MEVFIVKPNVNLYPGIRVTKDTRLEFKTETVSQTVEGLVMHTVQTVVGETYESTVDTVIYLQEGDILLYEPEGRGYIKPAQEVMTVAEAIEELACIRDVGCEHDT